MALQLAKANAEAAQNLLYANLSRPLTVALLAVITNNVSIVLCTLLSFVTLTNIGQALYVKHAVHRFRQQISTSLATFLTVSDTTISSTDHFVKPATVASKDNTSKPTSGKSSIRIVSLASTV